MRFIVLKSGVVVLVLKCFNMNCDHPPSLPPPTSSGWTSLHGRGHVHRAVGPGEPVTFLLVCERFAEKCFLYPSIFNLKSLPELVILFLVSIKNWLLTYFVHLYNLIHTQRNSCMCFIIKNLIIFVNMVFIASPVRCIQAINGQRKGGNTPILW